MSATEIRIVLSVLYDEANPYRLSKTFEGLIPLYTNLYPCEKMQHYRFRSTGKSCMRSTPSGYVASASYFGEKWSRKAADKVVEALKSEGWKLVEALPVNDESKSKWETGQNRIENEPAKACGVDGCNGSLKPYGGPLKDREGILVCGNCDAEFHQSGARVKSWPSRG